MRLFLALDSSVFFIGFCAELSFSLCVLNGLPSKRIKKETSLSESSSHEAFCLGKILLSVLMF